MNTALDQLTTINLTNESLHIDGTQHHGIWLTLGFLRQPGATHHQLTPLFLSASQAQSLAMALLEAAAATPADASGQGSSVN